MNILRHRRNGRASVPHGGWQDRRAEPLRCRSEKGTRGSAISLSSMRGVLDRRSLMRCLRAVKTGPQRNIKRF
jgi:hypothetical protein